MEKLVFGRSGSFEIFLFVVVVVVVVFLSSSCWRRRFLWRICVSWKFSFFRFFDFRQEWVMGEEEEEYDTRVGRWWWLGSRSILLTLSLYLQGPKACEVIIIIVEEWKGNCAQDVHRWDELSLFTLTYLFNISSQKEERRKEEIIHRHHHHHPAREGKAIH